MLHSIKKDGAPTVIIYQPGKAAPCAYCGKMAQLRPYGKDDQSICYACGDLPENKETTQQKMNQALLDLLK